MMGIDHLALPVVYSTHLLSQISRAIIKLTNKLPDSGHLRKTSPTPKAIVSKCAQPFNIEVKSPRTLETTDSNKELWDSDYDKNKSSSPSDLLSIHFKPSKVTVKCAETPEKTDSKKQVTDELLDSSGEQTSSPTPSVLSSKSVTPSKMTKKCAETPEKTDSKEHLHDEMPDSSGDQTTSPNLSVIFSKSVKSTKVEVSVQKHRITLSSRNICLMNCRTAGKTPSPALSAQSSKSVKSSKATLKKTDEYKELPSELLGSGDWLKPTSTTSYLLYKNIMAQIHKICVPAHAVLRWRIVNAPAPCRVAAFKLRVCRCSTACAGAPSPISAGSRSCAPGPGRGVDVGGAGDVSGKCAGAGSSHRPCAGLTGTRNGGSTYAIPGWHIWMRRGPGEVSPDPCGLHATPPIPGPCWVLTCTGQVVRCRAGGSGMILDKDSEVKHTTSCFNVCGIFNGLHRFFMNCHGRTKTNVNVCQRIHLSWKQCTPWGSSEGHYP